MTMSVWEQRTSQLRRHRQMSSREVLHNSTGGEDTKDGATATPGGLPHPLSLHGKHNQSTPLGSLKRLAVADPLASSSPNPPPPPATDPHSPRDPAGPPGVAPPGLSPPDTVSAGATDATSDPDDAASRPEPPPPSTLVVPEPPEPSGPAEKGHYGPVNGCRSPMRNGERRHRAVKKFRPPATGDALTPEMAGHGALVRGRRGPPAGVRGQGGRCSASRSVSRERRTRSGEDEEEEEKDSGGEKLGEGR